MPTFLSRVFKAKSSSGSSSSSTAKAAEAATASAPSNTQPRWTDAWARPEVQPDEVQQLLRACTREVKSRALTQPFVLLPFRPDSDTTAARSFIRNYFGNVARLGRGPVQDEALNHELRLIEPVELCCILKWCWSRLPGGVVTWEAYELFKVGEHDSEMARDSFATFIPLSVDSDARAKIIFDFFDLLAAIAAHGKTNGFGGRKLSRLAGWWAFSQSDSGNGFDGGYQSWVKAADATSHLFFAYLRSLSPEGQGSSGILTLPRSLQALLHATEYPPQLDPRLLNSTTKVVMIVDAVSPTPFALLRRAKNFEYRDDDRALRAFAEYEDPVQALTDECQRVIRAISSVNRSQTFVPKAGLDQRDESWSRFEDMGFSSLMDDAGGRGDAAPPGVPKAQTFPQGLNATARSRTQDHGRPVTPSWADFLSSGFVEESSSKASTPLLLPPDKVLPPIAMSRAQSSQSARMDGDAGSALEPGELASINRMTLDDSFWWVWIISLAAEEPPERKAVFGRCAVIETHISGARWLVMEEKVKGAAALPAEGAHIVEKKSRFGLTKRARAFRGKSLGPKGPPSIQETPYQNNNHTTPSSKVSIGPDQHARIQAAAASLQQKQRQQQSGDPSAALRRARTDDVLSTKTNSVFTLQPVIFSEAAPAMKWANKFDRDAVREAYLASDGAGQAEENRTPKINGTALPNGHASSKERDRNLPDLPPQDEQPPALQPSESSGRYSPITPLTPPPPFASTPAGHQPVNRFSPLGSEMTTPVEWKGMPPMDVVAPFAAQERPSHEIRSQDFGTPAASSESSPESQKPAKKVHKANNPPGGLKRLFGKKPPMQHTFSTDQPEMDKQESPRPSVGRRLSTLRKKASPEAVVPTEPQVTQQPSPPLSPPTVNGLHQNGAASRDSVVSALEPEPLMSANLPRGPQHMEPAVAPPPEDYFGDARPPTQAETPYEDAVAVAPEPLRSKLKSPYADLTPDSEPARNREDGGSDASGEVKREASPPLDRWAQIRKNAAQRAAAKSTTDLSTVSQNAKTEDDETSGEETIESRVARIKARVAELTGNMEDPNANGGRRPSVK